MLAVSPEVPSGRCLCAAERAAGILAGSALTPIPSPRRRAGCACPPDAQEFRRFRCEAFLPLFAGDVRLSFHVNVRATPSASYLLEWTPFRALTLAQILAAWRPGLSSAWKAVATRAASGGKFLVPCSLALLAACRTRSSVAAAGATHKPP